MIVIVRENCAGFDSFHTEIRLTDKQARLSRKGDQVVASINGTHIVQVTWVDETSASVFIPDGLTVLNRKPELAGVRFQFQQKE